MLVQHLTTSFGGTSLQLTHRWSRRKAVPEPEQSVEGRSTSQETGGGEATIRQLRSKPWIGRSLLQLRYVSAVLRQWTYTALGDSTHHFPARRTCLHSGQ